MMTVGSLSLSERLKLTKLYRNGPAAFGSISNLVRLSGLSRTKVKQFLDSKASYTKYKNRIRKFPRLHVFARFIDDIWCLDLAQVDKLSQWNSHTKFLMVCVDVFSRFIRVEPMKNKSSESTKMAFIKLCSNSNNFVIPKRLWIDRGKEFFGDFRSFCEDAGINVYHTFSETKASFAERAIRSLKTIIYKHLEESGNYNYFRNLPNLVDCLNSRINRSTGLAPNKVTNSDYLKVLYRQVNFSDKTPPFRKGDFVRIAKVTTSFSKGYKPQFTDELFRIINLSTRQPVPTYELEDLEGEKILGKFYHHELSKHISR